MIAGKETVVGAKVVDSAGMQKEATADKGLELTPELTNKNVSVSFDEDNANRNGVRDRSEASSDNSVLTTTISVTLPNSVVAGDKLTVNINGADKVYTFEKSNGKLQAVGTDGSRLDVEDDTVKIKNVPMQNNTEIVAIISSGASFHRFARPYFIASIFLGLVTLGFNHYILPWANAKKNKLEAYTYSAMNRDKFLGNVQIATKLSKDEYIFINNYNRKEKDGTGFTYQKFNKDNKLIHQVVANNIKWDEKKKKFALNGYLERKEAPKDKEKIYNGDVKWVDYRHTPEELFPDGLLGQTRTTPELLKLIEQELSKGNNDINPYFVELHQRTSMPASIIILSILALSLSSEKRRGGIGLNLAIGIALAFIFVFSFEALKVVAENDTLPPLLAMWLPNIVFTPLAIILYLRRANQ